MSLLSDLHAARERRPRGALQRHLPMTRKELDERGIAQPDIVLVTGDAYIDHPSFAMAVLGRVLEASGFSVAILSQPDWRSAEPWRALGRPRLFYGVSAGNMDSMINLYTANRKPRSDDAYSPGGRPGLRPERSTPVYCQRCREAFPGVPVIAGGVEASLRRLAHYDYWSDTVRPSILVPSKCDLLTHGMGERPIHEIAVRLAAGESVKALRDMRGVAYLLGASEEVPSAPAGKPVLPRAGGTVAQALQPAPPDADTVELPSFEEISPPPGVPQGALAAAAGSSVRPERGRGFVAASESKGGGARSPFDSAVGTADRLAQGGREMHSDRFALDGRGTQSLRPDLLAFARATRLTHHETNPLNARRLIQRHGDRVVVVNPPAMPLTREEMDAVYDLPYLRAPHPSYTEKIPACEMIRDSVTIMRGCFGGCTFCSITAHQGRIISSRSKESVLREVRAMGQDPAFKGTVSDLGGPTANMYEMRCTRPEIEALCRRLSCVHPSICPLLGTDHGPLIDLMKKAREAPGVKRVNVASGIRMDLARRDPRYIRELAAHHVGGHLKVAPEHTDPRTLELMKKPSVDDFELFAREFRKASAEAGKPKQFLVPYFIASHPGSSVEAMIDLALYLKRNGYRPRQVQDFIPAPMDVATCMYYTGLDPITMKEVPVVRGVKDRKVQRALMQFFAPENYFEVQKALIEAGRRDLIGDGCDALIPASPPPEAIEARREAAQKAADRAAARISGADKVARAEAVFSGDLDEGGYTHAQGLTPATNASLRAKPEAGYRPGRKTARLGRARGNR